MAARRPRFPRGAGAINPRSPPGIAAGDFSLALGDEGKPEGSPEQLDELAAGIWRVDIAPRPLELAEAIDWLTSAA
jgi:hypothetical protein